MKSIIREYAHYLLSMYSTISVGDEGRVSSDLNNFYEEGRIKDLVGRNSGRQSKINVLEIYKDKILEFAKNYNRSMELVCFDEFKRKFEKDNHWYCKYQ